MEVSEEKTEIQLNESLDLPKVSTGAQCSSTCACSKNVTKSGFYTHSAISITAWPVMLAEICLPAHADVDTPLFFRANPLQVPAASKCTSDTGVWAALCLGGGPNSWKQPGWVLWGIHGLCSYTWCTPQYSWSQGTLNTSKWDLRAAATALVFLLSWPGMFST